MRRSRIGLAVFTCAPLLLAFAPSASVAQGWEVTIRTQSNNDWGDWQFANVCVEPGDYLLFRDESGTWGEGNSVSGPDGSTRLWPDNFLNLTDLGVGRYQATTPTEHWDALVGYIGPWGTAPPARGDYTRTDVRPKAERVFPVFPVGVTSSYMRVQQKGCLWFAFNADAYSNYTVDNWGEVKVSVEPDTSWQTRPDLAPMCQVPLTAPWFKVACWVAITFLGDGAM